ncbi:unnamed protein product [Onchocerca flexuosa]|uniref:Major sperm protein n=1 Tax=Onchocerca flexuosa TaxID=387005 RepID=A0A183I189_9BILA|nr:unnamed protein product [Onchocerca flexuosa]
MSTTSQKLSESKLKTGKSTKSSEELKSSPLIRSVERLSSRPRRSSRLQRFQKLPTVQVDRSIARNLDEKIDDGLKIEPKSLNWNISGGVQRVYLTNPSNERRAIKVKCSDNHLYRVNHVFGFIEPGQMFTIDVVRQNGGAKTDKMAMETDKNASVLFKKLTVYPLLVLPLTVNNHHKERDDLKMEPVELHWNTNGGVQKVFISNPTKMRRALKVKCSDNDLYRVNPVYSFIEPGQVLAIDIFRQNGGAKVDKMVFLAAMAGKDEKNPRSVFQDDLPKPMMVLPLIASPINA